MTTLSSVLPTINGVSASAVYLPIGHFRTYFEFLMCHFPNVSAEEWTKRILQKNVLTASGEAITKMCPYVANTHLYYYRNLPIETAIPFKETILFQDDYLIVVDKPHFLPVIPSGKYVQETVLVRLKNELGIDTLAPIHRLDRDTAGLLLLSVQPDTRSLYHALFAEHQVHKRYEAIARFRDDLYFPLEYQSRIVRGDPFFISSQCEGIPNSHTVINMLAHSNGFARYCLKPKTGKKHQLRVHMAALGIPIKNDPWYPTITQHLDDNADIYANPLQLLAQSLAFKDPITGKAHFFESQQTLLL